MSNNGNVWDEVGGPLIIPSILLLVTTALELLSHIVTDTSLRVASGMRGLRGHDDGGGEQPHRSDKGVQELASCGAVLRWLAGGRGVFRSGLKLLYALYLVCSDTTTVVHLFFFVSAVLACTSSYTFACLNVFALVEQVPTMMYVLQVVRQNGRQMLVTILFAFMVVYVFAV